MPKRLLIGALWGVGAATVYFPLAVIKYHITASDPQVGVWLYWTAFVCIVVVGAILGGIIGALRPLLRWGRWGAALIGAITTIPVVGLASFYAVGSSLGDNPIAWIAIIIGGSTLVGALAGAGLYSIW